MVTSHSLSRQHLAFLDLCTLAWQAKPRRAQVYSLDRAGRAGVWSSVCEQCLSVIDSLTHKLTGDTPPAVAMTTTASLGSDGEIIVVIATPTLLYVPQCLCLGVWSTRGGGPRSLLW